MGEMSDWIQSNWFELASLLVQCAILATLARYGRKTLRIVRDSLNQGVTQERPWPSNPTGERPTIQQAVTPTRPEGAEHGVGETAAVWQNLTSWLQEPMESAGVVPRGSVMRWLKAPM
jgi:hypothetical protein